MSNSSSNYSINYIIASHPGKIESRCFQENSEFVLSVQLLNLKRIFLKKKQMGIENHITQITIVKTQPKNNDYYHKYYDALKLKEIEGVPIVVHNYQGSNTNHSYDQFLQGMEAQRNFDYFIIMEDDQVIDEDNITFDIDLVRHFNEKFVDLNGYLCVLTLPMQDFIGAAIPHGILHSSVLKHVSECRYFDYQNVYSYKNIYPQLRFIEMFVKNGVPIKGLQDEYYTPFWDTTSKTIIDYTKNSNTYNKRLILPIQSTDFNNLGYSKIEDIIYKELLL